jgi:Zn finger protein HypA/HybF involved in hydrogenase expression
MKSDKNIDIIKEWSPKNDIKFTDAIVKNKYWWMCENGHEYQSILGNRKYQKTGCPYCKSKLPSINNNLKIKYPEISNEWDYDKNENIPEDFLPSSNKKANWKCEYGHNWITSISNRTRQNNNCPKCFKNESWCENFIFSVFSKNYKVSKLSNPEIDIYIDDLNVGIEYDGYYHKFRRDTDISKNKWASENLKLLIRIREKYLQNLPECENVIVISQENSSKNSTIKSIIKICDILKIDTKNIDFDTVVDSKIRNKNLPEEIINSWSNRNKIDISRAMKTHKYYWICEKCESEYESEFRNVLNKKSCPYCTSQKVNDKNSITHTHPYLLKFISKDNDIDPNTVTFGTGKKLLFTLNKKEYRTYPRNFYRRLSRLHSNTQTI